MQKTLETIPTFEKLDDEQAQFEQDRVQIISAAIAARTINLVTQRPTEFSPHVSPQEFTD
jgi:hypothetical protein